MTAPAPRAAMARVSPQARRDGIAARRKDVGRGRGAIPSVVTGARNLSRATHREIRWRRPTGLGQSGKGDGPATPTDHTRGRRVGSGLLAEAGRVDLLLGAYAHPDIKGQGSLPFGVHPQRVYLDLLQLRQVDSHLADRQDGAHDGLTVGRRLPTESAKLPPRPGPIDQTFGLPKRQRRQGKSHVPQALHLDTSRAEHDQGSELRVLNRPDDDILPGP